MSKTIAAIVLAVAFFAPRPAQPCSPIEEGDFEARSVPSDDSVPFPHDASPLVIVGHNFLLFRDLESRAAIFDSDGVEVPVDLEVSGRSGADWIRLHPRRAAGRRRSLHAPPDGTRGRRGLPRGPRPRVR